MSPTVVEPKPGVEMGRVTVEIEVENYDDWRDREDNGRAPGTPQRITCNAIVDTGATLLCLPTSIVRQLGLTQLEKRRAHTAARSRQRKYCGRSNLEK